MFSLSLSLSQTPDLNTDHYRAYILTTSARGAYILTTSAGWLHYCGEAPGDSTKIFVGRDDALSPPEDIGIVTDSVEVLNELSSVASACAMLFGLIYTLNLNYPVELKYTFETFQKIMDIESRQMSWRVQNLCVKLKEWVNIKLCGKICALAKMVTLIILSLTIITA